MTIKAIETHYASCRFRSRLEARWAVFFDTANIPWRYEPEGFELSTGRYLPDFFLPTCSTWIEVKGDEERVDPVQLTTAALELPVIKGTGEIGPRLMVLGPIPNPPTGGDLGWWGHDGPTDPEWDPGWCTYGFGAFHKNQRPWYLDGSEHGTPPQGAWLTPRLDLWEDPSIAHAYRAARSARFEHGERG